MERRASIVIAVASGLAALVVVIWFAVSARAISVPLFLGFATAYLLNPFVDFLCRRGINRTLAISLLVLGFAAVAAGLFALAIPAMWDEFRRLPGAVADAFYSAGSAIESKLDIELPTSAQELRGQFDEMSVGSLQSAARFLYGETIGVLGALAGVAMIPLFAFFLLRDFHRIVAWVRDQIPVAQRDAVSAWFEDVDYSVGRFIRGQLLVSAIMAVLYSVGLKIVGLPLAIAVGVLSGLGNMIPYVGTAIGILLATILVLVDWNGWTLLLLTYLVYAVVQLIEGWFLTPKIVGDAVGISPLGIVIAILVFGKVLGFLGVLIAVPLAIVIQKGIGTALEHWRASSLYRGDSAPPRARALHSRSRTDVTPDAGSDMAKPPRKPPAPDRWDRTLEPSEMPDDWRVDRWERAAEGLGEPERSRQPLELDPELDEYIRDEIEARLARHPQIEHQKIRVIVSNAVVILRGAVSDPAHKDLIDAIVRHHLAVEQVRNQLEIVQERGDSPTPLSH